MGIIVDFGGDIDWSGERGTPTTIAKYVLSTPQGSGALGELLSSDRQHVFNSQGGWFFDEWTVDQLRLLKNLINDMRDEIPRLISHYPEHRKPRFYTDLDRFEACLVQRIHQLSS